MLVQGQNYTHFDNASWRGTQEVENARLGTALAAAGTPRPIFPYLAFYAPQSWYRDQARFNDPEPRWQDMWLRDSNGAYASMTASDSHQCCPGEDEGGNYAQYPWRRLYDWRREAARTYLTQNVIKFVMDNPQIGGAFFDDVSAAAGSEVQCGCDGCECRCGNWTAADRAEFVTSTLDTVDQLLSVMGKAGKLPILSTDDGGVSDVFRRMPMLISRAFSICATSA